MNNENIERYIQRDRDRNLATMEHKKDERKKEEREV